MQLPDRSVFGALFSISAAGLIFEISLTRLFSLYFQYHFAFLAISLAILGISLGAAAGRFLTPALTPGGINRRLGLVSSGLGLAFPLTAILLAWLLGRAPGLSGGLVALIPFSLIGLFGALTFSSYGGYSGWLYAVDLSGAAVGVAAGLLLLGEWSGFNTILLLGLICALAGAGLFWRGSRAGNRWRPLMLPAICCLIPTALIVANLSTEMIGYHPTHLEGAARDKTMVHILQDPTQEARIEHTEWSPFARVDVVQASDPDAKYIFTDAGAGSYMLRFDGDLNHLSHLKDTIDFLPFSSGRFGNTLVIGAGGGKDILLALLGGAERVTAVEVNPAVIEATRTFSQYNGGVLDLLPARLVQGDGRTFVERSREHFNLIYLNLVYTQAAKIGSQALVENYIFTTEAFQTYLERLTPDGRLAVVSHSALEGSRAAVTALQAMDGIGVPPDQGLDHLAIWMYPADDPTQRTSVLVVGKEPLNIGLLRDLSFSASLQGMSLLFVPGEFEFPFAALREGMSMDDFVQEDAEYDLSPTQDDKPYFFDLDPGLPPAVRSALVAAGILAGLLSLLSLLPEGGEGGRDPWLNWTTMVVYAALIGIGFMLIEIPLIQHFQLLLGYPVLSLGIVLGTLLLTGGLGSRISQGWREATLTRWTMISSLSIAALAALYWAALPAVVDLVLQLPLAGRLLVTILLSAALGVPMGIPFPNLMRLVSERRRQAALLWGINGAYSVVGSVLAVVISMTVGFRWSTLSGAALYFLLAGILGRIGMKSCWTES